MYDVCIADDEILIQQSIMVRLRSSGVPVRVLGCAGNAESAIVLYWSAKPDVFFVDINMPGADGLSLVRRIREEDPGCSTKFIIITGYDDFAHMREAIQSGVMDYLKKPISTEEFNAVLASAVKQIRQEHRKNFPEKDGSALYDEYITGGRRILSGGTLLAAYAPSADILNEHEKKGKNLHVFLKGSREEEKGNRLSLSFQNVGNIRLYYCPDCVMLRKDLYPVLHPLTVRAGMSFVYAYPRAEALELLTERLEQSLNSRFLHPALIECSGKAAGFSTDTGMLDYTIENGQQDSCRVAIGILLDQISAGAETIGEVSSFYRHIILLLINKYVTHNISMPGPLKLELSPFALCRYPNLETLKAFLSGTASSLARIIGAEGRNRELIPGVIEYLKQNYRNNITLNDLSGHFYVTPSYLCRRFREKTGLTLVEYLEEMRLEKAEEYLTSSDTKITDISEQVGYMDPNYFSKIFKRKYHLSPRDYRMAHLQ